MKTVFLTLPLVWQWCGSREGDQKRQRVLIGKSGGLGGRAFARKARERGGEVRGDLQRKRRVGGAQLRICRM